MEKKTINRELKEIDIRIGQKIAERRAQLGMTQTQVADRIGTTFQQVQKYEKAQDRVAASRLYRLHEVLEVPVSYFFVPPLVESAGLDTDFTYDPGFVEWVRHYPRISVNLRKSMLTVLKSMESR